MKEADDRDANTHVKVHELVRAVRKSTLSVCLTREALYNHWCHVVRSFLTETHLISGAVLCKHLGSLIATVGDWVRGVARGTEKESMVVPVRSSAFTYL